MATTGPFVSLVDFTLSDRVWHLVVDAVRSTDGFGLAFYYSTPLSSH
jgi:hypothetical protein